MKQSNLTFRTGGVVLLLALFIGCVKETDKSDYVQTRFVKLFDHPDNTMLTCVIENSDGTFYLGELNNDKLSASIIHAGKYGEILNRQTVELGPNEVLAPVATRLSTGEIVFTSHFGSRFTKLNTQGEIVVNKRWSIQGGAAYVAVPFLEESDNLLIGVSEYNTGGTNVGVFRIDPQGQVIDVYNIDLAAYDKAIFSLSVAKAGNGKMLLVGDCKPLGYKYSDKAKLFVAEFDEATETLSKVMIIDGFDDSENDFFSKTAPTDDGFVMMSAGTMIGMFPGAIPAPEFELFFRGDDSQLLDSRRYSVDARNGVHRDIMRTKDIGNCIQRCSTAVHPRDSQHIMSHNDERR